MADIPRKRQETKATWNEGKNYVLDELRKREEIKSVDLVKELREHFKLKNDGSAYGIINALIQHNQIHYAVMSKGGRMLYFGPSKGKTVIIREEGEKMPEVEPEAMRIQDIQSGKIVEEPFEEAQPEEIVVRPEPPPMRKEPEPIAKPPITAEQKLSNIVRSTNRQVEVDKAVKDVTMKTIKGTLYAVEQELEASLSIENRAKLVLTYKLALASGFDVKPTDSVVEQLIELKKLMK